MIIDVIVVNTVTFRVTVAVLLSLISCRDEAFFSSPAHHVPTSLFTLPLRTPLQNKQGHARATCMHPRKLLHSLGLRLLTRVRNVQIPKTKFRHENGLEHERAPDNLGPTAVLQMNSRGEIRFSSVVCELSIGRESPWPSLSCTELPRQYSFHWICELACPSFTISALHARFRFSQSCQ